MGLEEGCVQFNNLNLNLIDNSSGVFIGNNTANGWRSVMSINQGFGTAGGCIISDSINIVFDNDVVDTIIEDSEHHLCDNYQTPVGPQNQSINFQTLNINAVNANSAVSIGESKIDHWRSSNKTNMGFGMGVGVNIFSNNVNMIDDQDIIDAPIKDFKRAEDNKSPS